MNIPKDVEVELTFLTTEEGGRRTPAFNGYRPQFYYGGHDWDGVHAYIGRESVQPGETAKAYIAFLSPEFHIGRINPGLEFLIREGTRTVARGRVVRIIDLFESAWLAIAKEVSPWTTSIVKPSFDGRFLAEVPEATEIGMGAPTSGKFTLRENRQDGRIIRELDSCSPSLVWSYDSTALAIPVWKNRDAQSVAVISAETGKIQMLPEPFRILRLHTFSNGIIRGVDSPVFERREIEIEIK